MSDQTPGNKQVKQNKALSPFGYSEATHRRWRWFWREMWMQRFTFPLTLKLTVTGRENIPADGAAILIYNHISAIDPAVVVGSVLNRYVIPMAKVETLEQWFFKLIVSTWNGIVVRRGEVDRAALSQSLDVLNSGGALAISPEGTRSPAMIEAKEGVAYLGTKTNALIIPIAIDGSLPYKDNVRRLRRTPVTMTIGRGFKFKANGRNRIPREEMALMTTESVYQIAKMLPPERRGFYSDLEKATMTTIGYAD